MSLEIKDVEQTSDEKDAFVHQTMLTCIGNKRKIVSSILSIINDVRLILKKNKLNIVDGFAGSCVVSRELTYVSENLYSNDMELYSYLMSYCYLVKPSDVQKEKIIEHINKMNKIAEDGPYV